MGHHYNRYWHHGRHGRHMPRMFGGKLFILLLVGAALLGLFMLRRENRRKAGIEPKPFAEEVRELYGQLKSRLAVMDIRGMIDDVLGKGVQAA